MLLPVTLVAGGFTFLVFVNDWFWGDVTIFDGRGNVVDAADVDAPVPPGIDLSLADIDAAWAGVYRIAGPLLVLLVIAGLVGPVRARRGAALAAAVVSVITGIALAVGWFDIQEAVQEYEGDAREIASGAPPGYVHWDVGSLPRVFAVVALVILVVVNTIVLLGPLRARPRPGSTPGQPLDDRPNVEDAGHVGARSRSPSPPTTR